MKDPQLNASEKHARCDNHQKERWGGRDLDTYPKIHRQCESHELLTNAATACNAYGMSFTQTPKDVERRKTAGRRIVLIDIENVVGGLAAVRDYVSWAKVVVGECVPAQPDDQVVIGVGPTGLLDLAYGWKGVRYVMRPGQNGADLALLDVLDENIAARFTEVVLVSGDGIFTHAIAALAARGLATTVVANASGLSRRLELAAAEVRLLPEQPSLRSAAAVSNMDVA